MAKKKTQEKDKKPKKPKKKKLDPKASSPSSRKPPPKKPEQAAEPYTAQDAELDLTVFANEFSSEADRNAAYSRLQENGYDVGVEDILISESVSLSPTFDNVGTLLQTADDVTAERLNELIHHFMGAFEEAAKRGNKERISFVDPSGSTCFMSREEALFFVQLFEAELFDAFADHDVELQAYLSETGITCSQGDCFEFVVRLADASAVVQDMMDEPFNADSPGHMKVAGM